MGGLFTIISRVHIFIFSFFFFLKIGPADDAMCVGVCEETRRGGERVVGIYWVALSRYGSWCIFIRSYPGSSQLRQATHEEAENTMIHYHDRGHAGHSPWSMTVACIWPDYERWP